MLSFKIWKLFSTLWFHGFIIFVRFNGFLLSSTYCFTSEELSLETNDCNIKFAIIPLIKSFTCVPNGCTLCCVMRKQTKTWAALTISRLNSCLFCWCRPVAIAKDVWKRKWNYMSLAFNRHLFVLHHITLFTWLNLPQQQNWWSRHILTNVFPFAATNETFMMNSR